MKNRSSNNVLLINQYSDSLIYIFRLNNKLFKGKNDLNIAI